MDNLDETIISMNNAKSENKVNIEKGLYANNEFLEFKRKEVLDGKLSLMMPCNFAIMSAEHTNMKFPSEDRPQEIWTSPDTATNFGISHFSEMDLEEDYVKENADEMKNALKKLNPAMEFYQEGTEKLEDFTIAWFDYKSFGLDHDMYNIMFLASVDGKALHGVFICLYSEYTLWSEIAQQMLKSMSICEVK